MRRSSVDAPHDVVDGGPGEGGVAGGDGGVDVQQAGPVDGRGQSPELLRRSASWPLGRRRRPLGVDGGQVVVHRLQDAGGRVVAEGLGGRRSARREAAGR